MSAQDPFEQHRAAFGAELRRVAPKPRRPRRSLFALGGASVALAGAVTAAFVIAPTTGTKLDVLAEAKAAIAKSTDSILHYSLELDSSAPQRKIDIERSKGCQTEPGEVWLASSTAQPRFRFRVPMDRCSLNQIDGKLATGSFDVAFGGDSQKIYAESDGFMVETTGLPAKAGAQQMGALLPAGDARLTDGDSFDPVGRIRAMLAAGELTDAGEVRGDDGRALRKLVGTYFEDRGDPADPTPVEVKVDYRVDAETFAPVVVSTTSMGQVPVDVDAPDAYANLERREVTYTTTFRTFESIPLTPDSEHLLTVQPKAGTDVTSEKFARDRPTAQPSAEEKARAEKVADAQIAAGTRLRSDY